tara:strand:- start:423 stop:1496 length:1074 start_codon:yes stop_codon:yes gene_type:complete
MDGSYLNYSSLMNSALADATQKATQQKEQFESKLAKVGAEKSELLDFTNLAVMPFEAKVSKEGLSALSKGVDKISGGKITEFNKFINKKLTRVKTNAEKQLEKVKDKFKSKEQQEAEPEEETSENPSGESGEVAPEAVETTDSAGIDLYSFKDIAQDSGLYREYIRKTLPDYEGTDDLIEQSRQADLTNINNGLENGDRVVFLERGERDSLAPMRDELMRRQQEAQPEDEGAEGNSNVDVANNQARSDVAEQTSTTEQNSVDSASSNAVRDAGENAGIDAGESEGADALAGNIASNLAGDTALDGAGGALMDNPFTFFIGLAMMIGGIVGGVEGSRSIKNPTPKPVAVPNVSTQFGM